MRTDSSCTRWWGAPFVGVAVALCLGCGGPPAATDPAQATAALRTALDAWQKGEAVASLKDGRPSIQMVDPDWQGGFKLLRYEVQKEQPWGADVVFHTVLSLQKGTGKAVQRKAVYTVGAGSVVAIVRGEDF